MSVSIVEYINEWNSENSKDKLISVMPLEYGNEIYSLEVRFAPTKYNHDKKSFSQICNILARRSGCTMMITSSWMDFRNGILTIKCAFCNHGFSERKTLSAVKLLLNEAFPGLARVSKS